MRAAGRASERSRPGLGARGGRCFSQGQGSSPFAMVAFLLSSNMSMVGRFIRGLVILAASSSLAVAGPACGWNVRSGTSPVLRAQDAAPRPLIRQLHWAPNPATLSRQQMAPSGQPATGEVADRSALTLLAAMPPESAGGQAQRQQGIRTAGRRNRFVWQITIGKGSAIGRRRRSGGSTRARRRIIGTRR